MAQFLDDFSRRFKQYDDLQIEGVSERLYDAILDLYTSGEHVPQTIISMGKFAMEKFGMSSDSAIKCVKTLEEKRRAELSEMGYTSRGHSNDT